MKAKAGDVFCVWNEGLKKYTACQITKLWTNGKYEHAVKLSLDWTGDEPLTEKELERVGPIYLDYLFHEREINLCNVEPEVPCNYIYVGNKEALTEEDSNAYGGWDNGYIVYHQLKWQEIPSEKRDLFKAAANSGKTAVLSGREIKLRISTVYDTDIYFEDAKELDVLPCLTELVCRQYHPGICEYAVRNPFLRRLSLRGHGQKKLDFRGSRLAGLFVELDGVEEIWLNDELGCLEIIGAAPKQCVIHAKENGSHLSVIFHETTEKYPSLCNLSSLHCIGTKEIDFEKLYKDYPKLHELRIWGNPGYIRNFASIKNFSRLDSFSTSDMFGFTAEDIPAPDVMPNLVWLWMSSLPEDAAKEVKRLYKKRKAQGLDLRIEKMRKPEWISENMDNPFRSWDGEEHIPKSSAKRAASQYKKTRHELMKIAKEKEVGQLEQNSKQSEQNSGRFERAMATVTEYAKTFNRMNFIETQEREDIYEALCTILDAVSEYGLDTDLLLEHFDMIRDF